MKVEGNIGNFYKYSFPAQAALVTCNDDKDNTNAITIAWHTTISKKPPLYGISIAPSRYSHDLIADSKEFVINFAPYSLNEKVNYCGTHSGRNSDKVKEAGLTLEKIDNIQTPIIKECYAHLICKLFKSITLGDHSFFVGEVTNVLSDDGAFSEDILNNDNIKPCYYLGSNVYTTIEKIRKKF